MWVWVPAVNALSGSSVTIAEPPDRVPVPSGVPLTPSSLTVTVPVGLEPVTATSNCSASP